MAAHWHGPASRLSAALSGVFGQRLRSVVVYGPCLEGEAGTPVTCLALVDSLTADDLEAGARAMGGWRRAGLSTPLILTVPEFRRSLDTFPLEYGEIMRAHARVHGEDPFVGLSIAAADLRRACERQVASHLVHLREGYLDTGGRPGAVAQLVAESAPSFTAMLRTLSRLAQPDVADRREATTRGGQLAGVAPALVNDLLRLADRPRVPTVDAARLFPEYLAAVERLAHVIDTWPTS